MGKRPFFSFLLLSLLAILSYSNAPDASSVIGNSLFQLSESFNFDRDDYDALFSNKRILLASGVLIKNDYNLADLNPQELQTPNSTQEKKCSEFSKRDNSIILGGNAFLLIRKI